MYADERWPITGYRNLPVPNTFLRAGQDNCRLAVIFPGFAYSAQAPLLFYLGELLQQRGYDVLSVDYDYSRNGDFIQAGEAEQDEWFHRDVAAVREAVMARGQYQRLVLLGKSLGTTAMLRILEAGLPCEDTCLVWLTPGTSCSAIARTVATIDIPSLFLAGTADRYYRPKDYELIRANPRAAVELFPGAGHGLEIEGDLAATLENVKRCAGAVGSFLAANGY